MRHVWRSGALAALTALASTGVAAPPAGAPARGGWTRDGWSDAAVADVGSSSGTSNAAASTASDVQVPPDPSRLPVAAAPAAVDVHSPVGAAVAGDGRVRTVGDDAGRRVLDGGRGRGHRYRLGGRLPAAFAAPGYVVTDWAGYGLAPPPPGATWVRYHDDAVLLDRAGTVIDARPGIRWAQPSRAYADSPSPAVRRVPVEPEQRRTYSFTTPTTPGTTVTTSPDGRVTVTTVTTPSVSTTTTRSE